MRKRLACIIFLLVNVLAVICAINQDGHYKDSFEISAYKIGAGDNTNEYFALYVVDSIYDSFLNPADSIGNQIVIDNKVNYLFDDLQNGPQPRTTTFNADTMIFHVIAMGNRTGNYSLDLSFEPFKAKGSDDVILTAYTMGNVRINFENSEPTITENGIKFSVSETINDSNRYWQHQDKENFIKEGPILPKKNFTGVLSNVNGNLNLEWAIASINSIEESRWQVEWDNNGYEYSLINIASPLWIARAAVAMSIDKNSYDLSPEDEYRTSVTVTFTQN